jgi:hypothetical protein
MNRPLITDEEYAQEVKKHADYLNWVFGLSTIFLSISCLQFQTPWRAAVVCLGAVVPMYVYAFASFPRSLRVLRKLYAETKDPEVKARAKELERKFHGWRVIFTLFILWFALALFFSVLFSWGWLIHFTKA